MTITDDIKEQILSRIDLVEIVSEVVQLQKRGSIFVGRCPFHNEKTPSFNVNPARGFYKCFGCGAAGDAITFMMKYHKMDFIESVRELARRAGVALPERNATPEEKKQLSEAELATNAMMAAAKYYHGVLRTPAGKSAVSYFRKRSFSQETIDEFLLGFSPDSFEATRLELNKLGYTNETLLDAGLIIRKDDGSAVWDRFRGRAMFPIQNMTGKVIGFGARLMEDDKTKAKYVNSPQTIIYDKSSSLYGIWQAKGHIRADRTAILVEGYADVLTMHSAGFKNTIASSGTALTEKQLEAISRLATKLYVVYDADTAGIKAADRAIELALPFGFDVRIVQLPSGDDPDSLIRDHGKDVFHSYLDKAASFLDFKMSLIKTSGRLDSPAERAATAREIIHLISKIPDRLQHDDFIARLGNLLNYSDMQLKKLYEEKQQFERTEHRRPRPEPNYAKTVAATPAEAPPPPDAYDSEIPPPDEHFPPIEDEAGGHIHEPAPEEKRTVRSLHESLLAEERLLLHIAMSEDDAIDMMKKKFKLLPDMFITQEGKKLFAIVYEASIYSKNLIDVILRNEDLDREVVDYLSTLAISKFELSENWQKYGTELPVRDIERTIRDSIIKMEISRIDRQVATHKAFLLSLSFEEQMEILKKINDFGIKRQVLVAKLKSEE